MSHREDERRRLSGSQGGGGEDGHDCQAHPALSPGEPGQAVSEHTGEPAKLQLQPCTFASGELLPEWGVNGICTTRGPLLSRGGQHRGRLALPLPGGRRRVPGCLAGLGESPAHLTPHWPPFSQESL